MSRHLTLMMKPTVEHVIFPKPTFWFMWISLNPVLSVCKYIFHAVAFVWLPSGFCQNQLGYISFTYLFLLVVGDLLAFLHVRPLSSSPVSVWSLDCLYATRIGIVIINWQTFFFIYHCHTEFISIALAVTYSICHHMPLASDILSYNITTLVACLGECGYYPSPVQFISSTDALAKLCWQMSTSSCHRFWQLLLVRCKSEDQRKDLICMMPLLSVCGLKNHPDPPL